MSLVEQQSGKPACCKSDGLRFAGADTTVKLQAGVAYVLSFSITPAVAATVERLEVKHRQAECTEPGGLLCCCWPQANTGYTDLSETVRGLTQPARMLCFPRICLPCPASTAFCHTV